MDFLNFRFEVDADGIALATWDMPGRSMNVITPEVMDELSRLIDAVAADAAIKGCVIASGKEAFSGGADLTMLQGLGATYARLAKEKGEEEAMRFFFEESRKLSLLYRRLETCGKPFAAAMHGVCLGGAFELALACHQRVLSDADATRVGLPEIKVGLFPGAGGTQRVARLMQTGDALQMLFKGEQIRPLMARKMGLVHEVVPRDDDRRGRKDLDQSRRLRRRAVGRERIQAAVEQGLLGAGHADLAARQRHLPPRDAGQLSRRLRDSRSGLSGPAAADGSGAEGRVALVRQDPALEGGGGDDPHALRLDAGTEQGRAPAEGRAADEPEDGRRRRRRVHGRRHRLCQRARGPRTSSSSTATRRRRKRARPTRTS